MPVYRYCYSALARDAVAAEDCTQEVFLIFVQKQGALKITDSTVLSWLYTTARIVVSNYRKKNPFHDGLRAAEKFEDPSYAAKFLCAILRSYLTEEEYRLLYDYYNADHGSHRLIAARYGLQPSQLYERVRYIKRKLKQTLGNQEESTAIIETEEKGGSDHAGSPNA